MARSNAASKLAAKAAAVSNNSLKDRKVLKRMNFSTFEEEYLPEEWETVMGTSSVDGSSLNPCCFGTYLLRADFISCCVSNL